MPLTNTRCNTLINYNIVMCYNCRQDKYFALFCLEPKNIYNIKEIEEEKMFDKLGKEEP